MNLTFVTPWFGTERPGGAENLVRLYAGALAADGHRVRIVATTSASPHDSWSRGRFAAGVERWRPESNAAPVEIVRYPPDPRRRVDYDLANRRIMAGLPVSLDDEETWLRNSIHSTALLEGLANDAPDDLLLVAPYPFGLSYMTCFAFGARTVLIPCLHREGYAALALTAEMIAHAAAIIFNTPEERQLAEGLHGPLLATKPSLVAGPGMPRRAAPDGDEVRRWVDRRLRGRPYLLNLGWRDNTKGLDFLVACYSEALTVKPAGGPHAEAARAELPVLALAGQGAIDVPDSLREYVIDLGYLTEQEKQYALAGADWLINPSLNESFSFVLFEAWQAATPCLVHALCDVARGHVERANGGLYFANGEELSAILIWAASHPEDRRRLGRQGAHYAADQSDWSAVLPRVVGFLGEVAAERIASPATTD